MKILKDVSRKYRVAASAYRRFARDSKSHDFSLPSLIEQMRYESEGVGNPDIYKNGYTYGKHLLDITLAAMREDFDSGLVCKYDILNGSCGFVRREIKRWVPTRSPFLFDNIKTAVQLREMLA